ncbi:MAG: serine--tRNA ligase [Coriobacteriia bacterium]|nr:serine--tRNA ligase [Coriobacteriia bacterium]
MLEAKFIRENPEVVDAAMKARNSSWDVEKFLELDKERRALIGEVEALQARRNEASKMIGSLMQAGKVGEAQEAKARVTDLKDEIAVLETRSKETDAAVTELLATAPNIPDSSVPVGKDESENVEIKKWGTPRVFDFEAKAHWDLGPALGIIDFERGVKLAGSSFVVLAGKGAMLERALINFMIDTHAEAGFKEWWPPYIANGDSLYGTGQLPKFEDDLYKTGEGYYLIPTAEVQLTNLHRDEVLDGANLPLRYCAFTACFREEAGSAGRDTRGMIRVHQFDKVEMVKFACPEESFDELESMTIEAEKVLELLGLPYRRIVLCTGDMGFGSAKTYDIEVWLPSYNDYKEISSCSNCADFQGRRANIKYRDPENFKGSRYAHTLNGSGLAVGRCFAAIVENYQQADGTVLIPEVLRPYMRGLEVIEPE